ncbi:MAG: amidohydrolase family protein [Eubacteriales bacterium]|nr:amidohydrolase family protein [Eubacteriales bacterium]
MKRKILSLFLVTALVLCSFSFVFADQSYTVQPNDVLWKIAQKFDITYQKLAEYNGIKNPHLIFPNQIIKIPDKTAVKPTEPVKDSLAADTVLKNGTVYTIDKTNTVAQAVAIKGDEIIFVGSNADAEAYVGSLTKVVDLKGKVVMPGMVDTHVHRSGSALTELFDIYLYECIDKEDTLKAIKEFIDAKPDLEVYWGAGFSMGMAGDPRGPKAEWLDAICSDKPIILTSNDGHNTWLNTKALEMNGITKNTAAPTGGTVQKDPVTGELWGNLTDADSLISMEQTYEDWQITESMAYFQDYMNEWGYTSIMSISDTYLDAFKELDDKGKLTMRVNAGMCFQPDETLDSQIKEMNNNKAIYDSELVDITTVKFFADGVIEGMTGWLLEPYDKAAGLAPGYVSEPIWEQSKLNNFFDKVLAEGYQIHVHSIGDAATRSVLDGLEYAQKKNGDKEYRNVITHLQVVDNTDKARMGKLKVIGSTQPFWHLKEPEWWDYVDSVALGLDRAWTEYPVKSLIDNGVLVTFSGDHPVSPINNPFWAIEVAVTRNLNNPEFYGVEEISGIDDPTWLLNPKERISVLDAVKAYTINGAYQLYRDDKVGSIEKGKLADLIVVDQDIFKIDPLKIDKTKVLTTIINGKSVFGDYNY